MGSDIDLQPDSSIILTFGTSRRENRQRLLYGIGFCICSLLFGCFGAFALHREEDPASRLQRGPGDSSIGFMCLIFALFFLWIGVAFIVASIMCRKGPRVDIIDDVIVEQRPEGRRRFAIRDITAVERGDLCVRLHTSHDVHEIRDSCFDSQADVATFMRTVRHRLPGIPPADEQT